MVTKVLFVGLSYVGDVVMSSTLLVSLNKMYPDAKIDVVADKRTASMYSSCPFIGKVYLKDKNKFLRGTPHLLWDLRKNYYDIIVDIRTGFLAYLLKAQKKYIKKNKQDLSEHAVESLHNVIESIDGISNIPKTKVWFSKEDETFSKKIFSNIDRSEGKVIALSVGDPNKPHKNWPAQKYIDLLNDHKQFIKYVIYTGSIHEKTVNEQIINSVNIEHANIAGCSLMEAAAVLKHCDIYIGPDSGPGHIAAAVDTTTISFFSTAKPEHYRPWGNKSFCFLGENRQAESISLN
ncbi:MAG: glycosyltransferase family 9 protein, partial [Gammaproteobacteria bacterium]